MTWADLLQPGSYKGVAFDFVSIGEDHSNELDVQEFPGRAGAFIEPRARKARRFDIVAVFIDADYPDTMNALLAKIDEQTVGEFVHPVFGSIEVAVEKGALKHDVEDAVDSATLQLSLVEHTDGALGPLVDTSTIPALANAARSQAATVTASAQALQAAAPAPSTQLAQSAGSAMTVATTASSAATTIEDGTSTAIEIQSAVNGVRATIDSITAQIENYSSIEQYTLGRDLVGLSESLARLAAAVIESKPPLITRVVVSDISLLAWVHAVYGSSDRVDEILTLNSIPDPLLITAGTELKAYAS